MKSITELKKERMSIRLTNPVRASALMMIIDLSSKLAKDANREVTEEDIVKSANSLVKETMKDIELFKNYSNTQADIEKLELSISVYNEFLPTLLSEQQIRDIVNTGNKVATFELTKANKGKCMAYYKNLSNMDMKILSKILDEILA